MSLATGRAGLSPVSISRLDKLGVVTTLIALAGLFLQPFMLFRANRIVLGDPLELWQSLPAFVWVPTLGVILAGIGLTLVKTPRTVRLSAGVAVLALLAVVVGVSASYLTPEGDSFARVSPGGGFWILIFAFALSVTDSVARLRLGPVPRVLALAAVGVVLAAILYSGLWSDLSILKEYAGRANSFWQQVQVHLVLALGSMAAAAVFGIPLGIVSYRIVRVRAAILNALNIVQTIPSMAMFGLLIAPMAWVGATIPGAAELGIGGIGVAPAFLALFAYSLLPVVSNTVVGLDTVPREPNDAARGVGMTDLQRLVRIEMPLAFPVILTGIRIVLVQNIGLTVIAGLIGGGGLGTFVFQGISQTAMDLVLLGAIPAVAMAFAAAIVLDAGVELSRPKGAGAQR
ncbi:ABC transporter permease [Pelagibacterium xiamenense]|uniref:ABC transporter permease n=1 Tax=Pelagibacterium xiamenense TaxID=2901140 RepID=UPI001E534FB8|nr:ABC transporter permease [Pelagibacterium xiamenense]MCD7060405.1 ABC transporter permease [Pelagibacterium xiamenense]